MNPRDVAERQTRSSITVKQTNQDEKYIKHLKMFIDLANRSCSLVQLTIKMPSYTSTADFEMPASFTNKNGVEKNRNTRKAREKQDALNSECNQLRFTALVYFLFAYFCE